MIIAWVYRCRSSINDITKLYNVDSTCYVYVMFFYWKIFNDCANVQLAEKFIFHNVSRLFRRFWFIVLCMASFIFLSLGCCDAHSIWYICYIANPSLFIVICHVCYCRTCVTVMHWISNGQVNHWMRERYCCRPTLRSWWTFCKARSSWAATSTRIWSTKTRNCSSLLRRRTAPRSCCITSATWWWTARSPHSQLRSSRLRSRQPYHPSLQVSTLRCTLDYFDKVSKESELTLALWCFCRRYVKYSATIYRNLSMHFGARVLLSWLFFEAQCRR